MALDRVSYLIIDEADRMLDLGFKEQLNVMLGSFPPTQCYQVICCSATFTEKIRESVDQWCPDRYEVEIPNKSIVVNNSSEVSINPLITQDIQVCSEHKKVRKLMDFIRVRKRSDVKSSLFRIKTKRRRFVRSP